MIVLQEKWGDPSRGHRAGEAEMMLGYPTAMASVTSAPEASPTPSAMTSAQVPAVPNRPIGPCCSVDQIGAMIPGSIEDSLDLCPGLQLPSLGDRFAHWRSSAA